MSVQRHLFNGASLTKAQEEAVTYVHTCEVRDDPSATVSVYADGDAVEVVSQRGVKFDYERTAWVLSTDGKLRIL